MTWTHELPWKALVIVAQYVVIALIVFVWLDYPILKRRALDERTGESG